MATDPELIDGLLWKRSSFDRYTESTVSDGSLVGEDSGGVATTFADGTEVYRTITTLSVYQEMTKDWTYRLWLLPWQSNSFPNYSLSVTVRYKQQGRLDEQETYRYEDYTVVRYTITDDESGPMATVRFELEKKTAWRERIVTETVGL